MCPLTPHFGQGRRAASSTVHLSESCCRLPHWLQTSILRKQFAFLASSTSCRSRCQSRPRICVLSLTSNTSKGLLLVIAKVILCESPLNPAVPVCLEWSQCRDIQIEESSSPSRMPRPSSTRCTLRRKTLGATERVEGVLAGERSKSSSFSAPNLRK
ncbi:hypothetical protein LZ32DRAFT_300672 [Colletotrichum eremochloae]|nr:hypothetical protein LZ32DRAFT_300672 [Colletotrichum eremochloae]